MILFEWCYRYGFIEQLISDNDNKMISTSNRLFCWIVGTLKRYIMTFSPWKNGYAENRMKEINKAVLLENTRKELLKYNDIIKVLEKEDTEHLSDKDLYKLCCGLTLKENNKINETGYSPYQLRGINNSPIILDMQLKLAAANTIKADLYLKDGIVDYKKFFNLMAKQNKILLKDATLNKLRYLKNKNMKNEEKALESEQIKLYDHVFIKSPFKRKKHNSFQAGWVVTKIDNDKNKQKFHITNVINMNKKIVDKAQIKRLLEPVFVSTLNAMNNEITRLIDAENKQKLKRLQTKQDKEREEERN